MKTNRGATTSSIGREVGIFSVYDNMDKSARHHRIDNDLTGYQMQSKILKEYAKHFDEKGNSIDYTPTGVDTKIQRINGYDLRKAYEVWMDDCFMSCCLFIKKLK